ncbi:5-deoxy-glucuronate isomerase [Paenibacillus sp. JMULE4]|uniref:5-deoxy-glucuronate isomerase n=1 Tax=Paenibacillus sp. JMULE4 TaxID=2518342 RepID=UPI0015765529|nr:5-deoxy-glucuronate isomerase [Paenibacillus sp. JMULE4]NTZ20420.1 5-deoxy-glucuronate isomerase [Paenibacillus sp. JMULE4]
MAYLFKAKEAAGYQDIITEDHDLKYVAFGKISLTAEGEDYSSQTGGYETALVLLTGKVTVACENEKWTDLGERNNVFKGKATAVYIPCQSGYQVTAQSNDVQIAVCKVKAESKYAPFVVRPNEVVAHPRGKETWRREVNDIIGDNGEGRVHRMILGETYLQPGHWSSYPPHKFSSNERHLEAFFYYQFNPEQGYGIQMHYTEDQSIDQAYVVRHGDSFAVDRGYHPLSAAGGYPIYYLWVMAGDDGRTLVPYFDPAHEWLK